MTRTAIAVAIAIAEAITRTVTDYTGTVHQGIPDHNGIPVSPKYVNNNTDRTGTA